MAEVYLHADLQGSMPRSVTQRRRIMDFVRNLRDDPDAPGDFTDRDDTLLAAAPPHITRVLWPI